MGISLGAQSVALELSLSAGRSAIRGDFAVLVELTSDWKDVVESFPLEGRSRKAVWGPWDALVGAVAFDGSSPRFQRPGRRCFRTACLILLFSPSSVALDPILQPTRIYPPLRFCPAHFANLRTRPPTVRAAPHVLGRIRW